MSLGAQRTDVLKLTLGQGMLLTGIGSVIGLAMAAATTRFLSGMLFGVKASDPYTYLGVLTVTAFVSLLACIVPAARAAMTDPGESLRQE